MSAEEELPLPGEPLFRYKENLEALGALWDKLKADADRVDATTTQIRGASTTLQTGSYALTVDAAASVITHVSGTVTNAAARIRLFERPIKDYLAVLDAVRGPINTLRERWRDGERDLWRIQNGEAYYQGTEGYAEKWAARQTELRTAYGRIITDTVDPGKGAFVAALGAISRDTAPAATQPITLPPLPEFPPLPGVRTIDRRPPRGGGPGPGPGPAPQPVPEPQPEPGDPTAPAILGPWFAANPVDGPAILAAWLLLPVGATTYDRWAASAAGRTALATWIAKPRQDEVFDAWLATPAAGADLTTWIRQHSGLPEGQLPADPRAWIADPANAGHRSRWLAEPATRELMTTWISDPANVAHRTAWLADAKTQTGVAGWVRDPVAPANGTEFAAWTKNPTPVEPLRPIPEPDPTTGDPTADPTTTAGAGADDREPVPTSV